MSLRVTACIYVHLIPIRIRNASCVQYAINHNKTNQPAIQPTTYEPTNLQAIAACRDANRGTCALEIYDMCVKRGVKISVEMVQDAFSDSFWMKLSKYLPGQTITKLANLTGTVTCSAPYNETKEQFLHRVQTLVDEQYSGTLPSSYALGDSVPW